MANIPNFPDPAWSSTRTEELESCPRKYFYKHYCSYQGWNGGSRQNDTEARESYFWKNRASVSSWIGTKIHEGISRLLASRGLDVKDVVLEMVKVMQDEWLISSERGRKLRDLGPLASRFPKNFLLMEHCWGDIDSEVLEECLDKTETSLMAFKELAIRDEFFEAKGAGRYACTEESTEDGKPKAFRSIEIEASDIQDKKVNVWAMFDCAYEIEPEKIVVYDWKSGREMRSRESSDVTETLVSYCKYVLGTKEANRDPEVTSIEAYELFLPSGVSYGGKVTSSEMIDIEERIRLQAKEIFRLHYLIKNDMQNGMIECVPTPSENACRMCNFKSMCHHAWNRI